MIETVQGSYSAATEEKIGKLTQQEIIDVINAKNTSQIFMKDFDFKDLLGNIRYNQSGHIIGEETRSPGLVITLIQELAWWR